MLNLKNTIDLFFPKTSYDDRWAFTNDCRISRQRTLELRKYRPDFAKHLSDQTIILTAVNAENLFNSNNRWTEAESRIEEVKDDFVRQPCKKNPKLPEFLYSPGNWNMEDAKAITVLNKCI